MPERLKLRRASWPNFYDHGPRHHWLAHWPTLLASDRRTVLHVKGGNLPQKQRLKENRHHHALIRLRSRSKVYDRVVWWWPDLKSDCRQIVGHYVEKG